MAFPINSTSKVKYPKYKLSMRLFDFKQFLFCRKEHKWSKESIVFFKDEQGEFKDENHFFQKRCKSCGIYSFKHPDLENKWSV